MGMGEPHSLLAMYASAAERQTCNYDWYWGRNHQKANTWWIFKLWNFVSCHLFVKGWRHIRSCLLFVEKLRTEFGIWKKLKFQSHVAPRTLRERKKNFSFEWTASPQGIWRRNNIHIYIYIYKPTHTCVYKHIYIYIYIYWVWVRSYERDCLNYILRMLIDLMKINGFTREKARSRHYPAQTIMDTDYADDITPLANTPTQAKSLLHSLEQAACSIVLHVNADKTENMCFNEKGDISILNGSSLKLVDKFRSISSTENDINKRRVKAWTAIDRLSIIQRSNLSNKIKRNFSQAAVMSILLYGCTTWILT